MLTNLMLTPYYQDDHTVLYLGDSCEVFPQLGHVDAIVTDPPYGIGESSKKARTRSKVFGGRLIKAGQYHDFDWDKEPPPHLVAGLYD